MAPLLSRNEREKEIPSKRGCDSKVALLQNVKRSDLASLQSSIEGFRRDRERETMEITTHKKMNWIDFQKAKYDAWRIPSVINIEEIYAKVAHTLQHFTKNVPFIGPLHNEEKGL